MWLPVALFACSAPDPDALLRRHDLDGAAAAYEKRHGTALDVDHAVADVLATRAARDPSITVASIADAMEAVRLLEGAPRYGTAALDRPLPSMAALFGAVEALARSPVVGVAGRPETRADLDPWLAGGDLPWMGGRIVGWARTDLAALGAKLDADPPARKVTLAFRSGEGVLWLVVRREGGGWWGVSASDAQAAARVIARAEAAAPAGVVDPPGR